MTVLNQAIFDSLGFEREVDDPDLRFVLLPSVMRARRGSCVGLGSLYLAIGERLHLPLEGVMLPGHFFVRLHDRDRVRNVELLRSGEEMPDDWYRERFPLPPQGAHEYARALSPGEVLAIVAYDVGNERRRQGRLADARRAYELAVTRFSEFAEAQASLGAIHHLLGNLDAADARYAAARRANPALLGLDRNMALLEGERERARSCAEPISHVLAAATPCSHARASSRVEGF